MFKVGDLVKCIDNNLNDHIEIGKFYTVAESNYTVNDAQFVDVWINNEKKSFFVWRFELVDPERFELVEPKPEKESDIEAYLKSRYIYTYNLWKKYGKLHNNVESNYWKGALSEIENILFIKFNLKSKITKKEILDIEFVKV